MDFRDRFVESQGKPVEFEGRTIQLAHRVAVTSGERLLLRIHHFVDTPLQGLRIAAKGCQVAAVEQTGTQFVVWTDVAPERTELEVVKAKAGAELVFLNVWRDERFGSTMQGMNYAAMKVDGDPNSSVVLRCSDGVGPPAFDDLVVSIDRLGKRILRD